MQSQVTTYLKKKKKTGTIAKEIILTTEKAFRRALTSKGKDIKQQGKNTKQCCRTVKLGKEG